MALTLLAGTPALTFTGMIGAALAVTLHRGGLLLAVLVLPLSIPVLIFGVAASEAAVTGPQTFGAPFLILCALSLVSFVIGPFAAAASLQTGAGLMPINSCRAALCQLHAAPRPTIGMPCP